MCASQLGLVHLVCPQSLYILSNLPGMIKKKQSALNCLLEQSLFLHCPVLVGSRNRFKKWFKSRMASCTIKL